jgi:hypothetical protein
MGMGYGSNFAEVIDQEKLKKLVPKELKEFLEVCEEDDTNFEEVAELIQRDDFDNISVKVQEKYLKLRAAFTLKTKLTLELHYHNSDDEGSCYDDVSGVYWSVDGMYELSPAGKKLSKIVERKFFVTYG